MRLKKSKLRKISASILSVCLSLSIGALNVSAFDIAEGLTPVSETAAEEAIDISEYITEIQPEYPVSEQDIAHFEGVQETGETVELTNNETGIPEPENNEDDYGISLYSEPNPLSKFEIIGYALAGEDGISSASAEWEKYYFEQAQTSLSLSIDSTDYSYISFYIYQWGYTTSTDIKLDGHYATQIKEIESYNRFGNKVSAGDIVYGFLEEYIFEIPFDESSDSRISKGNFRAYYSQLGDNISKSITVNLTWTTPVGPAPTTPTASYGYADHAAVTGLSTDMEYRGKFTDENGKVSYSKWNSVTAETMYTSIFDYPYTFQVRNKVSTFGNPSLNCDVPIKGRSAAPTTQYVGYYSINELLAIYPTDKQIEIAFGDGNPYIPSNPAYYNIASFIDSIQTGAYNRIYIRYSATADEPASSNLVVQVYGRNPNTPNGVYYQNGMLCGLTPNVIFRFNGGDWYNTNYSEVNVTSFMSSTAPTVVELKYAPTSTYSCSKTIQITLPVLT